MSTRRKFIEKTFAGLTVLNFLPAIDLHSQPIKKYESPVKGKTKLRFALASDAHYGEEGTDYKNDLGNMINWLNEDHQNNKMDFVIANGDLVHDRPDLLSEVDSDYLKKLNMPYYAVPGNHDHVTTEDWRRIFGYEDNFTIDRGDIGLVLGNTTNVKGNITGPDNTFLEKAFDNFSAKKTVLVVLHIPPVRWLETERYFFDFPKTIELLNAYPNIKAVFCGHDHSLDGVRPINKIPCFFDSHIGGSWGTAYKGYRVVEIQEDNSIHTYQVNASKNPLLNSNRL